MLFEGYRAMQLSINRAVPGAAVGSLASGSTAADAAIRAARSSAEKPASASKPD